MARWFEQYIIIIVYAGCNLFQNTVGGRKVTVYFHEAITNARQRRDNKNFIFLVETDLDIGNNIIWCVQCAGCAENHALIQNTVSDIYFMWTRNTYYVHEHALNSNKRA